ncbi:uncharacterized protein LOC132644588 [Lycium barbarum]|uniref:uncharacterized protein LOC132644588 n=1 Tax=Lycium barbarum TaxID=112863 RepID=UPI00293EF738|nr:uncharacterized protein LOC132644588 [Lycium barbarum]XP_060217170.1 uncharacterized protein LOC132644588 [Lycium barbarum]
MYETFNSWILIPRFKSIITMLEEIKIKVMERMNQMREFAEKWVGEVSPMAMKTLKENVEVKDPPYKHVVNLKKKACSCRSWQLKGIICAHAITAIQYKSLEVEAFVEPWYKKATYLKAYNKFIQPMTNMKMWPKSTRPPIEPPKIAEMPSRPKKKRNRDADEPKKKIGKATRKGRKMTCSICNTMGHNKKGCPLAKSGGASSSIVAAGATNAVATAGPAATATTIGGALIVGSSARGGARSGGRDGARAGARSGGRAGASGATRRTPTNATTNSQPTQSSTQQSTTTARLIQLEVVRQILVIRSHHKLGIRGQGQLVMMCYLEKVSV